MLLSEMVLWKALVERHYDMAVYSVDIANRGLNLTLKVTADRGEFYLRLYRETGRTRREIDAEIAALVRFRPADNVYVAKPQGLRRGGYVLACRLTRQRRWATLFASAPGREALGSAGELRQLGKALAVLHRQMAFARPLDRPFDAAARVSLAADSVSAYGGRLRAVSQRIVEVGSASVAALSADGRLRSGFCHGDVWLGKNVHFAGARTTFFDFDDCINGPLVLDLATILSGLWYAELADFPAQLTIVLDAYAALQPLPRSDVMAIPAFIRLFEIGSLGFLARTCRLEPRDWDIALQRFERRLEEWGAKGAATAALRDYAKS